jgi:hypothetical protein
LDWTSVYVTRLPERFRSSARSIATAIGRGSSNRTFLTSIVLAFILFFYIFAIGSLIKPTVYVLQDRVSVYRIFYEYVVGKYWNHLVIALGTIIWLSLSLTGKARSTTVSIYGILVLVAVLDRFGVLLDIAGLLSIPLILSFFLFNKFTSIIKLKKNVNSLTTNYLSIIAIATGTLSLYLSSSTALAISFGASRLKDYAYILLILFSSFSPVLLILLVFSLPIKLLSRRLAKKISTFEVHLPPYNAKTNTKILCLSFFMGLSIILGLISHQPSVNADTHMIGSDSRNYVRSVESLEKSGNTGILLNKAFISLNGGDRPLSLLFLLLSAKISPYDHSFTIDRMPLILSPTMVLVVFLLTRELTSNDIASLLAAFLTVVSFHTLVGTYAGFYANWLALITGYLSFIFAFKYLKNPRKLTIIIFSTLIVITLFCHVYTWTVLTIVSIIFLGAILKLSYYSRKRALLLLLVIFASIAIDAARVALTGAAAGIERDINVAQQQQAGLGQFNQRWYNLLSTTHFHYGSLFGNSIFFALGLYWLFKCKIREPYNILLLIFLSLGIIPLFLGDWVVQSRVFYNIPFQIPAAIALTFLLNTNKSGALVVVVVCIWLMAFSVRAVSNF